MKKVNIGLIGLGRIGKLHAENLAFRIPEAKLIAIAEIKEKIDETREFAFKIERPGTVTDDYRNILMNNGIDAVIICSSTNTHAQIIIEAAKAKKHIFCEKPIDFDLKKIDKALEAVKKAGIKLQIGFNRRFDPHFAKVKEVISKGKIGNPRILNIISYDPAPPPIEYIKVSGGMFKDMTIHDFDMARFLIDSEVEEIFARGTVMVDPKIGEAGDIDTAIIVLKFKNGVIGTITNCREAVYGYDQRVEVLGSKGNIRAENPTENKMILSIKTGVYSAKPLYFFIERYTESYIREMQAFIDAITNDTPTPVSGLDGKIPVIMALAAQKSLKEKRVVRLSEVKGGAE